MNDPRALGDLNSANLTIPFQWDVFKIAQDVGVTDTLKQAIVSV